MEKIYVKASYGFREDPLENWVANNPVLEKGEPSIVRNPENESEWLKIGDGVTSWVDLPWKKGPKGDTPAMDQTYTPESENAQSGKAVAEAIQPKLEIWQPNKEYKVGDIVLRKHIDFANDGTRLQIDCVDICNKNHISVDPPIYPFLEADKNDGYWDSYESLLLEKSVYAKSDFNGNVIDKTYATKDEVSHLLSGGLTRQIYPSLTDITPSEEFANVIAMIPNTSASDANVYDEYIATLGEDGKYYFEKIGSTEVDLSNKMDKFGEVTVENYNVQLDLKEYDETMIEGTDIVIRGIRDPEWDIDAVNKRYVDTQIGDIDAALDAIIELQNSIIGGE